MVCTGNEKQLKTGLSIDAVTVNVSCCHQARVLAGLRIASWQSQSSKPT